MVARSWGYMSVVGGRNAVSQDAIREQLELEYHSRIEALEKTIEGQRQHIEVLDQQCRATPLAEATPVLKEETIPADVGEEIIQAPTAAQPPSEPTPTIEEASPAEPAVAGLQRAPNSEQEKNDPNRKAEEVKGPVASEVVAKQQVQKQKMMEEEKMAQQQNDMLQQSKQSQGDGAKVDVAPDAEAGASGNGDGVGGDVNAGDSKGKSGGSLKEEGGAKKEKQKKVVVVEKNTPPVGEHPFGAFKPTGAAYSSSPIPGDEEKRKAHQKLMRHVDKKDNTPITIFKTLPSSDVWCYGEDKLHRVCRFRNLCFSPKHDEYFILQTNRTLQNNVPLHRFSRGLLELGTVAGHPFFAWNFAEVSPFNPEFQNIPVRYEETLHFILKRLHPRNIMHNLHDDVLGMYFMLKEFVGKGSNSQSMPFSLDTHRLLIEGMHGATDSTRPFQFLSKYPLRYGAYLRQEENVITCFRDAVVGNSKLTTWYQYGFDRPQGPIENKIVNGMHVREVAEWFVRRMGIPLGEDEDYNRFVGKDEDKLVEVGKAGKDLDYIGTDVIVILSRKSNRLILNEKGLAKHLEKTYGMEVKFVRNEDHSFDEQITILRRAKMVIGMHGSILVMGMFCRRGTVLVEVYPFGVPAHHYTPYRTMANLPGMALIYRALEIAEEKNAIPHPERIALSGGLKHLPKDEQEKIKTTKYVPQHLCCTNPYWLYRIYQDTIIPPDDLTAVLDDALKESQELLSAYQRRNWEETDLLPTRVRQIHCMEGANRKPGELWARWDLPWNGAKVDQWNIVITNTGREYVGGGAVPKLAIGGFKPGEEVELWVRPIVGGFKGEWGAKQTCVV
ncbi:Protein O-linked-mannose beta-1,4-N-acetylglucosaminyltransferase 2 [Rhizophlyctis rosea]|uniref:Protein O-linked-mannose beta-1,4-N-acetylglucosaminyltransferase 2 n=1 Tax=Rhizophlyctis rosea TaxID=64517 RepID=A0AAD5SJV4_9FUNG|nr:Protein O-linked-mannose beta-1,4-N-acetylglucosaminyltransferase 2 [Rhizophlyctis rosea]